MKQIFPILLILTVIACTVPFEFQSENFEEVLVINGKLTDSLQVHSVSISYTQPLGDTNQIRVVEDAQVKIQNSDGGEAELEYHDGAYHTTDNFRGTPGVSYRLTVLMSDGATYQSNFEELIASPPIDSIYDRYAELAFSDQSQNDKGIQFFVDTHDDTNKAKYFRYEHDETWQVRVPYPGVAKAEVDTFEITEFGETIEVIDTIFVGVGIVNPCYEYDHSRGLNIGTTVQNSVNRLTEHPLKFISQSSQKIRTRISFLAKQYTISEDAYLYYRKLKENNESSGTLFDRQTGTVQGNVYNANDPTEPVLGYFEVSGYTEKREFFSARDFPDPFRPADFRYTCNPVNFLSMTSDSAKRFLIPFNKDRFYVYVFGYDDSIRMAIKPCTSCAEYADTKTPDYWIEN